MLPDVFDDPFRLRTLYVFLKYFELIFLPIQILGLPTVHMAIISNEGHIEDFTMDTNFSKEVFNKLPKRTIAQDQSYLGVRIV